MPLPAVLTYNELDGEELRLIIENRFEQFLRTVPHFQKHLTLPRVRITVQVKLEVWADQPTPETIPLGDRFEVLNERENPPEVITAESVDSTAPGDGYPPDEVRDMHGLPISRPARGPSGIGGQVAVSDQYPVLEGREVEGLPGLKISRTGSGIIDGMPTSANATVAKIDQGPAGLRTGKMNRDAWHFGGGKEK